MIVIRHSRVIRTAHRDSRVVVRRTRLSVAIYPTILTTAVRAGLHVRP